MIDLNYRINSDGNFIIQIKSKKSEIIYTFDGNVEDVNAFIDELVTDGVPKSNLEGITKKIKELRNMFQVQCLSTYGGPGLGKSTTALSVTGNLKKWGIDADYTSEVAKDKVYGKNLKELKDQSSIIGEQIKRLNTLVKSRDVTIAVQDSPFILSIAYQNKEDPHVDEEDFKKFYIKQYLNYINLNILLKRKEEVEFQEAGRVHGIKESVILDEVIKKEVLIDNGLCFIELPAYEASRYMVQLGITMDNLTILERYEIFKSSSDKIKRSINYHKLILEKTLDRLNEEVTDINVISERLDIEEEVVLKILREYKNINNNEYLTNDEMIFKLQKELDNLDEIYGFNKIN